MDTCGGCRSEPCCEEDLVRLVVSWEQSPPASRSSSFHIGIPARKKQGVDVERDKAGIGDQGEEVVAD